MSTTAAMHNGRDWLGSSKKRQQKYKSKRRTKERKKETKSSVSSKLKSPREQRRQQIGKGLRVSVRRGRPWVFLMESIKRNGRRSCEPADDSAIPCFNPRSSFRPSRRPNSIDHSQFPSSIGCTKASSTATSRQQKGIGSINFPTSSRFSK